MRMCGQHDIDRGIELSCDVEDRAAWVATSVVAAVGVATLVHYGDDCLYALGLKFSRIVVDRLCLVDKTNACNGAWHDDARSGARHCADEADAHPIDVPDSCGGDDRLLVFTRQHIGRQECEARTRKLAVDSRACLTISRWLRLTTASRQSKQVCDTMIEFMISQCADIDADCIHHLNGRLVMKEGGGQWRRPDEVAGGHDHVRRLFRL